MPILDASGHPITSRKPETREIAVASIRDKWASYPSQGLTPQRLAAIFKEADQGDVFRQMELFEEMEEKDTDLMSFLQTRKLAVAGLPWEIAAASEDSRDEDVAAFCREALAGLEDFEESLLDLLDAVGKGFSVMEIMWDIDGKRVLPSTLEFVPQRRFTFFNKDIAGGVLKLPNLITDSAPIYGMELPAYKFIVHVYKAKSGSVPRGALLRPCAWLYLFSNYNLKDWVTFCEVYGMPLRLGKYDPSTSREDKDALIQAVTMLGTDAAGVISKSTEVEFIETAKGTQGADVYKLFADFCSQGKAKAILGQTLTSNTGEKGSGSRALGQVHNEVRNDLRKADARALARTIKTQLLAPLVFYNFGPDVTVPGFTILAEDPEDLGALAERDERLARIGTPIPLSYIREKYGIPEPEGDEEVLKPNVPPPSPSTGEEQGDGVGSKAALKKKSLCLSRTR